MISSLLKQGLGQTIWVIQRSIGIKQYFITSAHIFRQFEGLSRRTGFASISTSLWSTVGGTFPSSGFSPNRFFAGVEKSQFRLAQTFLVFFLGLVSCSIPFYQTTSFTSTLIISFSQVPSSPLPPINLSSSYSTGLIAALTSSLESMISNLLLKSGSIFFMEEFQWFLMELSVLPGRILEISAHLFPSTVWAKNSSHCQLIFQSDLQMVGLRWLNHLYLHCLPQRRGMPLAMIDHF